MCPGIRPTGSGGVSGGGPLPPSTPGSGGQTPALPPKLTTTLQSVKEDLVSLRQVLREQFGMGGGPSWMPQPSGGASPPPSGGGASPVTPSGGGASPYIPSGGGASPYVPSGGGASPVTPSGGGASPYVPSGGGASPYVPSGGGASPVTPSGGGASPYIPSGGGASPYAPSSGGSVPFPAGMVVDLRESMGQMQKGVEMAKAMSPANYGLVSDLKMVHGHLKALAYGETKDPVGTIDKSLGVLQKWV